MGANSRWAFIQGWALIEFSTFSAIVVCLFCNKTINCNNKTPRGNKVRFLKNTSKKTPSWGSLLYISTYGVGVVAYLSLSGSGREVGWGGRLLTLPAFRMGANSRLGAYSNKYGIKQTPD